MPKLRINVLDGRPLFDLASYARHGPGRRDRLTPAELAQISRTVHRVPEVVVKVLTRGSDDPRAVAKHFGYVGRYGELALETDEGELRQGREIGRELIEDWDLDLDEHRHTSQLVPSRGRPAPKLVHKLMLSMPAATPPAAVFSAARDFLREEFALKHRYAFVLHTDEPHPHVHAVVKAVSEQGERLHIRKATLREWRREFARHLRAQGVEANATERPVRGESRTFKHDGIYRAARRGESTYFQERTQRVASELSRNQLRIEAGKADLLSTRRDIDAGWRTISDLLDREGEATLAADVRRFSVQMPPVQTDKESLARQLLEQSRAQTRAREPLSK